MAFYAGVGVSHLSHDPKKAGRDAARGALASAGIESADIAIVVSAPSFDQVQMVEGIVEALGTTPFVGCTGYGAITGEGVQEQAVCVLVMTSDDAKFTPIKVLNIKADMREAGKVFARTLQHEASSAKMALIFSDALSGNGTEIVRGILEIMGTRFPLGGGAAGDDLKFDKTYQFFNGEVLTDALVGIGVSGNIATAIGADHGWEPIGSSRIATKVDGTKLIELDGKPAFSIYQDYFGARAEDFKKALSLAAVSYPLGMRTPGSESIMVRAPLIVGQDGSIVCGAEVVKGSEIYIMIGTLSSVLASAKNTATKIIGAASENRRVVFVSDCVARKILLGTRGMEEIEILKQTGGPGAVIFGFYSYGQIAPLKSPAEDVYMCDPGFYEQSISLAVLGS